jgi:hypothetical protein
MTTSNLWGEFSPSAWQSVRFVAGRLATEDDVRAGCAVFYLGNAEQHGGRPYLMTLPQCALWKQSGDETAVPGVIVQAEAGDGQVLVGFRPLAGGNAIALLSEFELVEWTELVE